METNVFVSYATVATNVFEAIDNKHFTVGLTAEDDKLSNNEIFNILVKSVPFGVTFLGKTTEKPDCHIVALSDAAEYLKSFVFHMKYSKAVVRDTRIISRDFFQENNIRVNYTNEGRALIVISEGLREHTPEEDFNNYRKLSRELNCPLTYGKNRAELYVDEGLRDNRGFTASLTMTGDLIIVEYRYVEATKVINF